MHELLPILSVVISITTLITLILRTGKYIGKYQYMTDVIQRDYIKKSDAELMMLDIVSSKINGVATKEDLQNLKELVELKLDRLNCSISEINNVISEFNGIQTYIRKKRLKK